MSKLSPALKALINAPFARAGTTPAPSNITAVYERIGKYAHSKQVSQPAWLAMATGATMTMNSPDSLTALYTLASKGDSSPNSNNDSSPTHAVATAELIREVGLKCIGFNGVPRTINMLNAFHASLPPSITSALSTTPTRTPTGANIEASKSRGRALWDSIYRGFEGKLVDKLAVAHPDLPVHIVNSEYGLLFSDPPAKTGAEAAAVPRAGRLLTSIVAVACLRAQTGVGPQVLSHVFGLRKALDDGTWRDDEGRQGEEGARWLASDEGNTWLLDSVDEIVEAIGQGRGSSYAPGMAREKAKL